MYWAAKAFQAGGLGLMALGFIKYFPNLMPRTIVMIALAFFAVGWVIQRFCLK